ncbi:unnamed protein product [Arabidopsis lyrata]|nr:unnamed protein product [Arabidopsis lyrata]
MRENRLIESGPLLQMVIVAVAWLSFYSDETHAKKIIGVTHQLFPIRFWAILFILLRLANMQTLYDDWFQGNGFLCLQRVI